MVLHNHTLQILLSAYGLWQGIRVLRRPREPSLLYPKKTKNPNPSPIGNRFGFFLFGGCGWITPSRTSKKAPQGLFSPPDFSAGRCCSNPPLGALCKVLDKTETPASQGRWSSWWARVDSNKRRRHKRSFFREKNPVLWRVLSLLAEKRRGGNAGAWEQKWVTKWVTSLPGTAAGQRHR